MTRLPVLLAIGLVAAAVVFAGPRGVGAALRDIGGVVRRERVALAIGALLSGLLPTLARQYVEVGEYLVDLIASTAAALAALVLAARFDTLAQRAAGVALRAPVGAIAAAVLLLAILAGILVLGDFPHVSDEVAYQFQGRTLAQGRLFLHPPPTAEPFVFTHTMVDGGRWYGIMNPGWPLMLAVGELFHLPWLVNPLLGALTVLVFYRAFRAGGIGELESRLATLFLALSPFVLFMTGTYMAHPANLLLLGIFCWAWARMLETGGVVPAVVAGAALGLNLMVRPIDAAAVALPFGVLALLRLRRQPALLGPLVLAGIVAGGGVIATLLYNQALTGDPFQMPMTKYFFLRNPDELFGLGFGPKMGTALHGNEWPGYYPSDAVRVTAYRLAQFAVDMYGLPLLVLALPVVALRRRGWTAWHVTFFASALALVAAYVFHFYHGVAYGSRHYYLAAPAIALLMAAPLAAALRGSDPAQGRRARVALTALAIHLAVFALPPLVRTYSETYRGSSPAIRNFVRQRGLTNALVFVDDRNWTWKSAFPLNQYPLERNPVIFARDMKSENGRVMDHFAGRAVYYLSVQRGGRVVIRSTPETTSSR